MRVFILACLLALAESEPIAAEPRRISVDEIPVAVKRICLGPLRDHCTRSQLPAADWVLAIDGKPVSMACLVHVEHRGAENSAIGCAEPWRRTRRNNRVSFDLAELDAAGVAAIKARCLDAREFGSEGLVEDNIDWARRATEHNATVDRQCMAEISATFHVDTAPGDDTVDLVLRNVQIEWP